MSVEVGLGLYLGSLVEQSAKEFWLLLKSSVFLDYKISLFHFSNLYHILISFLIFILTLTNVY